jgi:acetyl-CoA acetyltransferase
MGTFRARGFARCEIRKGREVMATERDLVVLGAGMHPWGKWGKNFVDYGLVAAKAALADADVAWRDIEFVAGADTIRNGYPGFVAGSTFSQAMGWTGAQISSSYAACASGAQAMQSARAQILAGFADVAMVIGADTTPKGFFAPVGGERKEDPDWQRFHLLGATNPAFFALNARRRIDVFGDTVEDFALVKVKNSKAGVGNPNARFRKEFTLDDFAGSPIVSDPLRLLDICATSDGAAAVIICTPEYAMKKLGTLQGTVRIRAVSNTTPTYPQVRLELPDIATDSNAVVQAPALGFKDSIAHNAYEQAGLGPEDVSCAEVYDLSTALELDWYENLGFCPEGEGARLVRDGVTALGGSKPVNASGGLASFGEAIPAQAIAQVCELTWQLQGRSDGHQVENAKVGLAINQGLFGHGSCTILSV